MAENNNTREMERKTPSKVPVALVTHRQQDWDMDKRDNLPEKQNIFDHIDLGDPYRKIPACRMVQRNTRTRSRNIHGMRRRGHSGTERDTRPGIPKWIYSTGNDKPDTLQITIMRKKKDKTRGG